MPTPTVDPMSPHTVVLFASYGIHAERVEHFSTLGRARLRASLLSRNRPVAIHPGTLTLEDVPYFDYEGWANGRQLFAPKPPPPNGRPLFILHSTRS